MCEISIIVPVYNVEKYLHKCVDSILAQTFTDFELILVDDGSPDNSGAICDEYEKKDERVKVIHKKNGGLSDARNAGIDAAQGRYFGFVDSDDYIENDMYELLYKNIIENSAEMSICGIYDIYKGKKTRKIPMFQKVISKNDAMKMVLEAEVISVHAVNKLYKRELFDTIKYPINKITEDAAIILQLLDQCQKVVVDSSQKYYYFHRENSISSNKFSVRDLDTIEVWENNEYWIKNRYPELLNNVHTRVCWANFVVLDKIILAYDSWEAYPDVSKKIRDFLTDNFYFIIKNQRFTFGRKLSMILLLASIRVYGFLVKVQYNRINVVNK